MNTLPDSAYRRLDAITTTLYIRDKSGAYQPANGRDVLSAAHDVIDTLYEPGTVIGQPDQAQRYMTVHFADKQHEVFSAVLLDSQHTVLGIVDLFHGTIDAAAVYPREVIKVVLAYNAAAVLFAHNHPSGNHEPSNADRMLTERLRTALQTIDVRVLDHLVIGGNNATSFAVRGWL